MIELIKKPNIDFMGLRKYAFIFSGILSLLGLIAIVQVGRGAANLGIDFAGGTAVQMKFDSQVSIHDVRLALEAAGIKDSDLQDFPLVNKVLIRIKKSAGPESTPEKIIEAVNQKLGTKKPVAESTTVIGPKVGNRTRQDAFVAVMLSTLFILIYIAFRFEWSFGIGATIATFHDVLAVLGIFYITGKEINLLLVSALLMIAGYSLTDTVVVFDRIRENLRKLTKLPLDAVINSSVNEVVSRTIIVSTTVFLTALSLFVFGGEVIHDFSLAILLGIVIGTYSSVFIASPAVLLFRSTKPLLKKN